MSKSTDEYVRHILKEIDYLDQERNAIEVSTFIGDETLMRAFARSLEIIGEAAKQVPDEYRRQHPEVDWKGMAGLRDRLIHHYFEVDYEIVWDVVTEELPRVRVELEKLIKS